MDFLNIFLNIFNLLESKKSMHKNVQIFKVCVIPLFHTDHESHELPQIDKCLDLWLKRTQFVKILTELQSVISSCNS